MVKRLFVVIMALALVVALTAPLLAAEPPPGRKIVVFQPWVVEEAQDELIARTGAVKIKSLPIVNAVVALAGSASDKALRGQAAVLRVEDDSLVSIVAPPEGAGKPTPPPPPPETLPWGVNRIDADLVWAGNIGAGVKVAIMDTGIDLKHPDLAVVGGVNAIVSGKSYNDDNGHGTHVAGISAALDNDIGVIGVAPGGALYAVKVLNRQGFGWWSDVIEGLQWSIQNRMQVVNMSFGASSAPQSVADAIAITYAAGIVLVGAAGNSGPADNSVIYPAAYLEVIAVSATNAADGVPDWSSRGPEVEEAAPGVDIYSTYKGSSYATLSGTSMAAPHVSGTVALVLLSPLARDLNGDGVIDVNYDANTNGKWDVEEVRTALADTADDLGATGRDSLYGYGLTDSQQAATGQESLP